MTSVEAGRLAGRPGASREPLGRAERTIVSLLATLLGSTVIGFVTIGGQLLEMERRIGGLHTDVEGIRTELHKEIGGLRAEMHKEIGGLRTEMREEIGGLRTEMREEIGKLSDRMDQLSDRMTRVETLIETHLVPASSARDPAGP